MCLHEACLIFSYSSDWEVWQLLATTHVGGGGDNFVGQSGMSISLVIPHSRCSLTLQVLTSFTFSHRQTMKFGGCSPPLCCGTWQHRGRGFQALQIDWAFCPWRRLTKLASLSLRVVLFERKECGSSHAAQSLRQGVYRPQNGSHCQQWKCHCTVCASQI